MKKIKLFNPFLFMLVLVLLLAVSCNEDTRFQTSANDTRVTGAPTDVSWKPLNGGARIHYTIPKDENLLRVDAEYVNQKGKTVYFTTSFYNDSIDVYGFWDTEPKTVKLYGVNRSGVRSKPYEIKDIIPLVPAVMKVAETLEVKPAFNAFFIDWINELGQNINVYVNFKYSDSRGNNDINIVFSSKELKDRKWIKSLRIDPSIDIYVTLKVEDQYGNITDEIPWGNINLMRDFQLDKSKFFIPNANDSTVVTRSGRVNSGVPAMYGENVEGRMAKLIDGSIDRWENLNFFHTGGRGRTGTTIQGRQDNNDWNIIIDLGGYYRLSRIVVNQRHSGNRENTNRGQFYQDENSGQFRLYVFNEAIMRWDTITHQMFEVPPAVNDLDWVKYGEAGDEALFYPNDPKYTVPVRWFRYETVANYNIKRLLGTLPNDYNRDGTLILQNGGANCMSEMTIFGIEE
jgi:hypothetical protein